MSEPDFNYFICHTPGLQDTTPVTIKHDATGFEARMGIAIFGSTNMDEDGFRAAKYNPFHELFHDNYVSGNGATQEEAIEAMKKAHAELYESIWY